MGSSGSGWSLRSVFRDIQQGPGLGSGRAKGEKGLAERYSGKRWLDFGEDCMEKVREGESDPRMSSKSLSVLVSPSWQPLFSQGHAARRGRC